MHEIKDCSLVLEGGTFRTIFTAGVLDALMGEEIVMPYIAAISAGAINAVSYMSHQPERTLRVLTTYRNDPRYAGARNFLKEKSYFGLDFAYNVVPNKLDLFDDSQRPHTFDFSHELGRFFLTDHCSEWYIIGNVCSVSVKSEWR